MKKYHRRVLLALGWYDYRLHRGIERYAQEHGWSLSANYARERIIPWGWDGEGILAWLGADDDLAKFVHSSHKPTVDFSLRRRHFQCTRVLEDHGHAARLAAEHFLDRQMKGFAFYSNTDNWAYEERGAAFVSAIKQAGHSCLWLRRHLSKDFRSGRGEWKRCLRWLGRLLKPLEQPVGVLAANDQHALEVLEACELAGLTVPEQVSVVGVGNYLLAAEAMPIPISSIDTNLELLGYQGAAELDRLMNGKKPLQQPLRIPAKTLVARQSSDLLAINHPNVARALRFIWDHAHEPIDVSHVVQVSGMSRRGLHIAFSNQIGRTPGDEIRRVRMESAQRMLRDTSEKIEIIAESCGYQSINSFCVAFKNITSLSPGQFRKKSQGAA